MEIYDIEYKDTDGEIGYKSTGYRWRFIGFRDAGIQIIRMEIYDTRIQPEIYIIGIQMDIYMLHVYRIQ